MFSILVGARTLLGAPGIATSILTSSNKKLVVTSATLVVTGALLVNKKLLETSATLVVTGALLVNKKLLETSATLVVTGALLVVTRSYERGRVSTMSQSCFTGRGAQERSGAEEVTR